MVITNRWEVVMDEGSHSQREGARRHNSAQNLRWLADLLDSKFNVLGIRIGWDAILGLIPGLGDLTTNLASFYILIQASNLGAPPSVILRMGLNILFDNMLDAVPLLGNIADIFWRSNSRNVALLERYMLNPRRTTVGSRWVVGVTVAFVMLASLASIVLTVFIAAYLIRWMFGAAQSW